MPDYACEFRHWELHRRLQLLVLLLRQVCIVLEAPGNIVLRHTIMSALHVFHSLAQVGRCTLL